MAYSTLTYRRQGRIGRITLNRPKRLNAISARMPGEIAAAVAAANIDPKFRNTVCDPANAYTVPYQWGTLGVIYRTDAVKGTLTWGMVYDPAQQTAPFVLMDEMRSTMAITLQYQGKSTNSKDQVEIKAAGDLLLAAKKSPKFLGFEGGVGGLNKVLAGEAAMAVVYNGDAVKNMPEDGSCAFAIPKEGSGIWCDMMLLSAKASKNLGLTSNVSFPGALAWPYLYPWPQRPAGLVEAAFDELAANIRDPKVELYVLYVAGCPAGYAELDFRDLPTANLNYFGLMAEFVGRGLGGWFLDWAVHALWLKGPARVTVDTCNLDHPRAFQAYQRAGFEVERRDTKRLVPLSAVKAIGL